MCALQVFNNPEFGRVRADSQNGNVPIGQSKTAVINESGLYSLILSSKLPNAKRFKIG